MSVTSAPISVLVVEDDVQFAKYLAMTLSASTQGVFTVEAVDRLEAGIERLATASFDVVLLDLELPGTGGLATLERLLDEHPHIAVVVYTGTAKAEQLAVEAVRRGAEDYLFKGTVGEDVLSRALRYAVERRRARRALERRTIELAQSNAELEQFATVASHDLQEPLRTITSYLELLEKRVADDAGALELVRVAMEGAERSRGLVNDLLQLAQVTTRAKPFVTVDASEPLRLAMGDLRTSLEQSNARVSVEDLPTVVADPHQLRSVFQNLLENALKYRTESVPEIEVTAKRQGADWVFSIRDNGIGIAPEFHETIFRLFERLHPQHRYRGSGVGLAIVRKIVERHGGRVWVESEEGAGATFSFTIPRFRPPPEQEEQ